jgi:trehalose/maltose hydrolase-like predicted phosphorylase
LFALSNGDIGLAGGFRLFQGGSPGFVVANGVYTGQGPETRLLGAPVSHAEQSVVAELDDDSVMSRTLDMRAGVVRERIRDRNGSLEQTRFVSIVRPGIIAMRTSGGARGDDVRLVESTDPALDAGIAADMSWMRVVGSRERGGIVASLGIDRRADGADGVCDEFVAYAWDPDELPAVSAAVDRLREARAVGFDGLLREHAAAMVERWRTADIVITGDEELQQAAHFALFHLLSAVGSAPEAVVGARGLTGPSYRGHVFWDADVFVASALAAMAPRAARAMLEYRIRRLRAARAAARDMGRRGARFPWESARTGLDVTPRSALDRAGLPVVIRTGELEEHIVADVAWSACCYVDWTGDRAFALGPGLMLLVDTARYWASRTRVDDGKVAHIDAVIGPDEYHEAVNDNAYTNVMARWNLRRAAEAVAALPESERPVSAKETSAWLDLASALVDGFDPSTRIYEQFAGFRALEPLLIRDIAPRRPIAADVLLGAERVRGAQVIKQADVLMLHHLVPEEVEPDSLGPNLLYYEPRTAHGSSLSPAVHASLFARAGDTRAALDALAIASRIDLDDLTGSTSGGLHLATMGGLWQAFAYGVMGLRPRAGRLVVDPRVPASWRLFSICVRFRAARVEVRAEVDGFGVSADAPIEIEVDGRAYEVHDRMEFARASAGWEMSR